jgi:hypothetical protein
MSAAFAGPCAIASGSSNVAANTLGTTSANNVLTVMLLLYSRVVAFSNASRLDHPRRVVPPASILL